MPKTARPFFACLSAFALISINSTATAGGLSIPLEETPQYTSNMDWGGLYIGGQGSLSTIDSNVRDDLGDGIAAGIHAGYLFDLGQFVIGGELDANLTAVENRGEDFPLSRIVTLKLRAGYDLGAFMPYVTAGASQAQLSGDVNDVDTGGFAGVGVDYRLNDRVSIGAEHGRYRYSNFAGTGTDFDVNTTSGRISYRF